MSRHKLLCRDKVWPNGEILCSDRKYHVVT